MRTHRRAKQVTEAKAYERIRYSDQRHDREPGAAWAAGVWHDDRAVEPAQRRVLRAERDDSGDGHLLWRDRPDHCRDHGMAKEQHLRRDGVYFLRPVLGVARNDDHPDKTWLGRGF